MKLSRVLVLVLAVVLVLLQAGCDEFTPQDKAFVRSLVDEWLESRDMRPTDDQGKPNVWGGIKLAAAMAGRSADQEANAVCGIYTSLAGVIEADKAMDAARANGDAEAMDRIISSRPHDWTYRSSRATLALAQGDMQTYQNLQQETTDLANKQNVPLGRLAHQIIKDYETIAVPDSGDQGVRKYTDLENAYTTLFLETGDITYAEQAQAAAEMRGALQ